MSSFERDGISGENILVAYDGSGSTQNSRFYHDHTVQILKMYPQAEILLWDSSHRRVSREQMDEINRKAQGFGGTSPSEIAKFVKQESFHGHLVIISDGQVTSNDIDTCSRTLGGDWMFDHVTCFLITTGGTVNMSISCPFTRNCSHEVHLFRAGQMQAESSSVSRTDLVALERIQTTSSVDDYMTIADALERTIIARTMGTTGDPQLRDAVLAMKKRIVVGEAAKKGDSDTVQKILDALEKGREGLGEAVSCARTLTSEYYGDEDSLTSWSGQISRLVSMCDGALRGTFDLSAVGAAIHSDRIRRATAASAAPASQVPLTEEDSSAFAAAVVVGDGATQKFECPISLNEETDVLLLISEEGEPVLAGLDKAIVNSLLDCPLNLLKYPEVISRLVAKIDHPIGLRSFKESMVAAGGLAAITESPFTRRSILGGICLAAHEDHSRATDWTLARAITDGKRAGNMDLWYACIWLLVENGTIEYLAPILPQLREHMRYRLHNHKTSISLSGLPEFPTTKVPLGVACWYVFASAVFGMPPARDVLRMHLWHIDELRQLTELASYVIPDTVAPHIERLRALLTMLSEVKKDRYTLSTHITALTQRCVAVDVEAIRDTVRRSETFVPGFVPIDGPADEAQVAEVKSRLNPRYRDFDIVTLTKLRSLVHSSKSASDISLPIEFTTSFTTTAAVVPVTEWKHETLSHISGVLLCPTTYRPYYTLAGGERWYERVERLYGAPPEKLVSWFKWYIEFVEEYKIFPTAPELMVFVFNRLVMHGGHRTLPRESLQVCEIVVEKYRELLERLDGPSPAKFVQVTMLTCSQRIRMEMERAAPYPS